MHLMSHSTPMKDTAVVFKDDRCLSTFTIALNIQVSHSHTHSLLHRNELLELPSVKQLSISPKLSRLNMKWNSITRLNDVSLVGYGNLTVLDLSENNIRKISAKAFAPTLRLKELDLSSNKFSIIWPGTFDMLPELEKLIIGTNSFEIANALLFQVC